MRSSSLGLRLVHGAGLGMAEHMFLKCILEVTRPRFLSCLNDLGCIYIEADPQLVPASVEKNLRSQSLGLRLVYGAGLGMAEPTFLKCISEVTRPCFPRCWTDLGCI